ncbi:MAG: hypothetical protein KC457_27530, partial [Myxococcales bacterium]|nr:hypothetical protein [Myxococcales bacterium]
ERLALLLDEPMPALPRCVVADGPALARAFARSNELLTDPKTGSDAFAPGAWLQQLARVRPDCARFDELIGHVELIADATLAPARVAQLPEVAGERWAATSAPIEHPEFGRARLCLWAMQPSLSSQAQTQSQQIDWSRPVSGLVIDSFVEQIPAADQVTGVALHFDAPSSRPPQSMLLLSTGPGQGFDFDLVVEALLDTLELAKIRAVDPDAVPAFGHHIPAIYPPGAINAGPQPKDDE